MCWLDLLAYELNSIVDWFDFMSFLLKGTLELEVKINAFALFIAHLSSLLKNQKRVVSLGA